MNWLMVWFGFCCAGFLCQIQICYTQGHGEDKWLAVSGAAVIGVLINLWIKDAKKT